MQDGKTYLYQFIPKKFEHLIQKKKFEYHGVQLKTAYLINIIHELILKYYFTNDLYFNLWSIILRQKYGINYHIYIDYLVEQEFIFFVSNYYSGKKSKTYKLNLETDIIRCKVDDKVLLKKYQKDYMTRSFTAHDSSPIDLTLRKKLIDDLYHVEIDYKEAVRYLTDLRDTKAIELNKYIKNMSSVDSINTAHIFVKFDPYGRMHTNFTILKKYIRQQCLTIDNMTLDEIDIKNSQPFFFACFLKQEIGEEYFNDEVRRYVDSVKNGLLYDELLTKFPNDIKNRDEAKIFTYKVLFGNNLDKKIECSLFNQLYPTVYNYIKEFKSLKKSYKELSHELQLLESNFIFGVIEEIKRMYPHIRCFTVHDSIVFPKKYKEEVSLIFKQHLKKLI